MRLSTPRIPPVDLEALTPEQAELLDKRGGFAGQEQPLNVLRTIAHAPRALKRFGLWSDYILGSYSDLSPRQRELLILRVGWLCRSGYEWVQHRVVGGQAGLSDVEIEWIKEGGSAVGWTPLEAALLTAVDELATDYFITDDVWAALAELGDKGRMDVVFTVGQYFMVSMFLNSAGVQLDPGQVLEADFPAS